MRSKRIVAGASSVAAVAVVTAFAVVLPAPPVGALTVEVGTEAQLRAAVTGASNSEPNVISLTADITFAGATDPLYVSTQPLTIEGNGHTLDGGGNSRVLQIGGGSAADLTVNDLVARNGRAADGDGGGAIKINGDLTIVNSTFLDNSLFGDDGGGAVHANSTVTITGSTFANNLSDQGAGAISSNDDLTITNSTVVDNRAADDGGQGGAVFSRGTVRLTYVTMSGNSTGEDAADVRTFDDLIMYGTAFLDPQEGPSCDVNGDLITEGYNYAQDSSCGLNDPTDTQDGADALLGALGDNGGSTLTMLPAAGSPLIDAIPVGDCRAGLTADQRGLPRPADGDADGTAACDIGAVEVAGAPPAPTTTAPATPTTAPATPTTAPPSPQGPPAPVATPVAAQARFTG